jgi:glutaconate CoA-transferase subunit A
MPRVNDQIRFVLSPYGEEEVAVVPPLHPDLAILHAQRADAQGNTQLWGLPGVQKEVAFAARKVVVVVEEIVDESIIRADPNRTLIPGQIVEAVVQEPFGAHPSYVQGYYDRDNDFYIKWNDISKEEKSLQAYLDEWIYGLPDRAVYVKKMGEETWKRLAVNQRLSGVVNYGF